MKSHVEFTKDYATKKKGDLASYDGTLASDLVHRQKVAIYTEDQVEILNKLKAKSDKQVKEQKTLADKIKKAEETRIKKVKAAKYFKKKTK